MTLLIFFDNTTAETKSCLLILMFTHVYKTTRTTVHCHAIELTAPRKIHPDRIICCFSYFTAIAQYLYSCLGTYHFKLVFHVILDKYVNKGNW